MWSESTSSENNSEFHGDLKQQQQKIHYHCSLKLFLIWGWSDDLLDDMPHSVIVLVCICVLSWSHKIKRYMIMISYLCNSTKDLFSLCNLDLVRTMWHNAVCNMCWIAQKLINRPCCAPGLCQRCKPETQAWLHVTVWKNSYMASCLFPALERNWNPYMLLPTSVWHIGHEYSHADVEHPSYFASSAKKKSCTDYVTGGWSDLNSNGGPCNLSIHLFFKILNLGPVNSSPDQAWTWLKLLWCSVRRLGFLFENDHQHVGNSSVKSAPILISWTVSPPSPHDITVSSLLFTTW